MPPLRHTSSCSPRCSAASAIVFKTTLNRTKYEWHWSSLAKHAVEGATHAPAHSTTAGHADSAGLVRRWLKQACLPAASSLAATSGRSTGSVVRCSLLYSPTMRSRLPICCLNLSACWKIAAALGGTCKESHKVLQCTSTAGTHHNLVEHMAAAAAGGPLCQLVAMTWCGVARAHVLGVQMYLSPNFYL